MTTRTVEIFEINGSFKLVLTTSHPKHSKKHYYPFQGYQSRRAAEDDVSRLHAHLDAKKHAATFIRKLGVALIERPFKRAKTEGNGIYGCAANRAKKALTKKYRLYCKSLRKVELVPLCKEEYFAFQNLEDSNTGHRAARAVSRDPRTRSHYLFSLLRSANSQGDAKTARETLLYMNQKILTLKASLEKERESTIQLRRAVYSCNSFNFIMKAKFVEDDEVEIVTEKQSFRNTSKEQLIRVTTQCTLILSVLTKLEDRARKEILLLEECISRIESVEGSILELQSVVTSVLEKRKLFKESHSMGEIVNHVYIESEKVFACSTIRKWYNEYVEYKMLKEDLRGCHERIQFLSEYGYKREFELCLKNERHLSVNEAKKNLEYIISSDPPTSEKGKRALSNLQPFSRSTIHRWMSKSGCKYVKASASYYTDSHEAEETKIDFRTRYECVSRIEYRCVLTNIMILLLHCRYGPAQ